MAYQLDRSWLDLDIVLILEQLNILPKNPKKWLPRFNPDDKISPEDLVKNFMQVIIFMSVIHEDVVCILFPYSFEG